MKLLKAVSSPVALALCTLIPFASAYAEHLNWKQRGQLFMKGTVTDEKGQTWNVILVPGVETITRQAGNGLSDSGDAFKSLTHKGFWRGLGQDFKDGLHFSKDVIAHHWIDGIKGDAQEAVEQNKTITSGEMGAGLEHFASWAWFGIKAVGRTVWMPIGVSGGAAYSVVAPSFMVVEKPVLEGVVWDVATRAAAVPAVLYVWNGIAWSATSFGNVPQQESFFVHLEYTDPATYQPVQLVLDRQGFNTLVQASVLEEMTDDQRQELQTKIQGVDQQIQQAVQPLQKQKESLENQQQQASENLEANPSQKNLENLLSQADDGAEFKMSSDAKDAYLDQAGLRDLVTAYLKSLGVSQPTPDQVDSICKRIDGNLQEMNVQMQKQAAETAASVRAGTSK